MGEGGEYRRGHMGMGEGVNTGEVSMSGACGYGRGGEHRRGQYVWGMWVWERMGEYRKGQNVWGMWEESECCRGQYIWGTGGGGECTLGRTPGERG